MYMHIITCPFSSIIYDTHAKTGQNQLKLENGEYQQNKQCKSLRKKGVHHFYASSKNSYLANEKAPILRDFLFLVQKTLCLNLSKF